MSAVQLNRELVNLYICWEETDTTFAPPINIYYISFVFPCTLLFILETVLLTLICQEASHLTSLKFLPKLLLVEKQTLRILTGPPSPVKLVSGLVGESLWPALGTFQDSVRVSPDITSYILKVGWPSFPHHPASTHTHTRVHTHTHTHTHTGSEKVGRGSLEVTGLFYHQINHFFSLFCLLSPLTLQLIASLITIR